MIRKNLGFTLIEALTVIGIVAFLAIIAIPSYASIRKNVALNSLTLEIANTLKIAQNKATSSQDGFNFGVRLEQNRYILCQNNCQADVSSHEIKNGFQVISANPAIFTFSRLSGLTTPGQIVVGLPGGSQKTIQIDTSGRISLP